MNNGIEAPGPRPGDYPTGPVLARSRCRAIYDAIASDADGRITLPLLIPGASYCVSSPRQQGGFSFHRDLIVKPGEAIDLGDIRIEGARP